MRFFVSFLILFLCSTVAHYCLGQSIAQLKVTMSTPYYSPTPGYVRIDLQLSAGIGYVTNDTVYNGANFNGSWEALNVRFTSTAIPALINTDFIVTSSMVGISPGSVTNVSAGGCYPLQTAFNLTFVRAAPAPDARSTPLTLASIDFPKDKGGTLVTGMLTVRATTTAGCSDRETFWTNSNIANSGFRLSGIGNSATIGIYSILPIKLESFDGRATGKLTQLKWLSANEQNTSCYAIEYAKDGLHFLQIGFVQAVRNRDTVRSYKFNHTTPGVGNNYYRLKIADNDGNFTYSKIINVFLACKPNLLLYPNPASEYIVVTHPATDNFAQIIIFNMIGKLVKKITVARNSKEATINIADVERGIYKLVWSDGSNFYFESLIIY